MHKSSFSMALVLAWYDLVCFGIVFASFLGALWVLWTKEGASSSRRSDFNAALDESLLLVAQQPDIPRGVGHVSGTQLWTSCWRGVHPCWLLATRFVSLVVMAVLLSFDVRKYDASIFVYYTEWTFTLVMTYFAVGTIVSAYGCWQLNKKSPLENGERFEFLKRRDSEEKGTANGSFKLRSRYVEQRAGFWGYLMQTTYQTCAGAVILTDIVFWCVIVPFLSISHFKLNMLMSLMHTLNATFLILDTALNNLPFPWFRLSYFVLWSCGYITFQWVIHACGFTWWPYPFLELNTPWAPLWYLCLAIIHIPCYGMYSLIVKAKDTILPTLFPHAFLRSH